jgi:peptidylprolyl isomerase
MSSTFRRRTAAAVLSALLLLAACGDDDGETLTGNVVKDGMGCSIASVDRPTDKPEVDLAAAAEAASTTTEPEATTTEPDATTEPGSETTEPGAGASEVGKEDLVEGSEDACAAATKPYLTLDMVGVKASDGTEFVNTYGEDRPVTAQLGQGQLIPGLETGLAEMRVGGRRQITVPSDQAYGADGNPDQGIGPDETLVFVLDLVAVGDVSSYCNANTGIPPAPEGVPGGETKPSTAIEMPIRPFEELEITTVTPSEGVEVKEGDDVLFNYLGISCASGQQFDSSWDRGEPLDGTAGGEGLIEGFSKGLIGARVGELRRVDIPAEQAYGDDAMTFLIQVTEIVPPEAEATTTETSAPADGEDGSTTTADSGATTTTEGG